MQVTVEHLGGVQFEIKARQHRIACDPQYFAQSSAHFSGDSAFSLATRSHWDMSPVAGRLVGKKHAWKSTFPLLTAS